MKHLRYFTAILALLLLVGCASKPSQTYRPNDRPPKLLYMPLPVYPPELRLAGVNGSATVEFIVTSWGDVVEAYAVEATHLEFAVAAVEGVLRAKFEPGLKNGKPVHTQMSVPIYFNLEDVIWKK